MKLSDIDFSAISNMMNSLSDEEKNQLNTMAEDMMQRMTPPPVPEDDLDYTEALGLNEETVNQLPGEVLNNLEAAWDMENFYDEEEDADYSAAVLFYSKALLALLRKQLYPVLKNVPDENLLPENPCKKPVGVTTLQDYMTALFTPGVKDKLIEEGFGDSQFWNALQNLLVPVQTALARAEYDFISLEDLQALKTLLLEDGVLVSIASLA